MTETKNARQTQKASPVRDLYEPLDFVVVRAPVLPVEFYEALCGRASGDNSLLGFLNNERVRFAIDSASPSLAQALRSASASEKDRLRARRKFRRYLIRMSTRPTPFGAFAGVAIAALGERTTLRLDETTARYCKHLDVPWLLKFVHKMESDPQVFQQLKLQTNPCTLVRGGRVYVRELSSLHESGKDVKTASLRASSMVTRTLVAARLPIAYEELAAQLSGSAQTSSSTATHEKVRRFLTELWRQGFLLTELRPPFTNGDPAQHVAERLKSLDGADAYRRGLQHALDAMDVSGEESTEAEPGNGSLTHIDSVVSTSGELNAAVAREAARAAELLLSMSNLPAGPPHLQAYRRAFEDRYGIDREVPLIEMVDQEYGIGFPPGYDGKKNSGGGDAPAASRVRRETLFDLARYANDERRLEVELDHELLGRLRTSTPNAHSAPASLELNVFVSAASSRDLDEGRFTIVVGPNVGAMEGGRSLGRFAGALGAAGVEAYRNALQSCEPARPGKHCVELSYLPRNLKLTNILFRPSGRRHEINVGVHPGVSLDQSILVDELLVGMRDGRFYVRSPQLDGDLVICSGHMANPQFAPYLCRLLTEITLDGVAMLRDFDWGMASILHFLPRVRVGRIVLSVAKWRISADIAGKHFRLSSPEEFERSLASWRQEWKVPRHVHLAEADNRLTLDLENEMDREDLRAELRALASNQAILLEEVYPNLDETWLRGSDGRFVAEYVVPLAQRHNGVKPAQSRTPDASVAAEQPGLGCRVKTPGSDWLYVKLYAAQSVEDDLLLGPAQDFLRWAAASDLINEWFFIRYADPNPHIRLRFRGVPAKLSASLLPKLIEWAQMLVKEDRCMRFAIDTYEREIERYGGLSSIENAERLFCFDSQAVVAMLRAAGADSPVRPVELAVFGLDSLFQKLGCNLEQRLALFKSVAAPREESGPIYRERKAILQTLGGAKLDSPFSGAIHKIKSALDQNSAAIADIGQRFRELDAQGGLARPLDNVFRSIAHMHCNRVGLDQPAERLAYGLLTRSYETSIALSKQNGNRSRT